MGGTLPERTFQILTRVSMTSIIKEEGAKTNCVGCFVCVVTFDLHINLDVKPTIILVLQMENKRLCELKRFAPSHESKIWRDGILASAALLLAVSISARQGLWGLFIIESAG